MRIQKCACVMVCVLMACAGSRLGWAETSLSVGMRYDTFADDRSPEWDGTEMTIPLGVEYRGEQMSLRLESAYSQAVVTPGEDSDADLSGLTDTLVAVSYQVPDLPVGLIVGVSLNLPTGQERLSRHEQYAEAGDGHDLFEVDNFGEGFNAGLNLGVAKKLGPVHAALSGAYIYKGQYDPSSDIADDDLDPGDQTVAMGILRWKAASWLTLESRAAYSHIRPETTDDEESFQEGDKILFNAAAHMQGQTSQMTLGLQYLAQGKNRELVNDALETEAENSNGSELFGWVDVTYRLSSRVDLEVLGDARWYGESDRVSEGNDRPFEGRRARYSGGAGLLVAQNNHLSWNVTAKYFVMTQDADISQSEETTFRGMNVNMGLTYTF